MKYLQLLIILLLLSFAFFSCKKDDVETKYAVEGSWEGVYSEEEETPTYFYRLNIKHGGVIEELNEAGEVIGSGTWNFNVNLFTAQYRVKGPGHINYSLSAVYDAATKKLTGTWGFENSANDGGKWETTKKN